MKPVVLAVICLAATFATPLVAQNRIDGQSPDAPALAAYGALPVGVRRFDLVNPDQIDILKIGQPGSGEFPRYDRPLTVEMWYPAAEGSTGVTSIETWLRDGTTPVKLEGRAIRGAAAAEVDAPLPLVILSHGYPGNRFLMAHFAENLASKGYVVASIDHTDSTYRNHPATFDPARFASTLVNRSLDQVFVLNEMARLNEDADAGLAGLIDADNSALIGYSMGGYGAIVTSGGGVAQRAVDSFFSPQGVLGIHQQGSATHNALPDPRIKTTVAIGPWGEQVRLPGWEAGFWGAEGLAGIDIPMLFFAGSNDTTSGYANGVEAIFRQAVNSDRTLITFEGAGHNAVAPIPAPAESFAAGVSGHYTTEGWDTVFMNNVGQHFVTAWFDLLLKGDTTRAAYFDFGTLGGATAVAPGGFLKGFVEGTTDGIRFETLAALPAPAPVPLPGAVWLLGLGLAGIGGLRALQHGRSRRA